MTRGRIKAKTGALLVKAAKAAFMHPHIIVTPAGLAGNGLAGNGLAGSDLAEYAWHKEHQNGAFLAHRGDQSSVPLTITS